MVVHVLVFAAFHVQGDPNEQSHAHLCPLLLVLTLSTVVVEHMGYHECYLPSDHLITSQAMPLRMHEYNLKDFLCCPV